ncbi:MAG: twin-arginine translocation signal domain-containing protein [Armatimonadetes bacterium]|nr:twin-arginine translocation signal domain-containing protein [Armatimonadota bacterium]
MPLSRREFLRAIAVAAAAVGADPLIFSSLLRRRGLETMADAATGIGRLRVAQGTSEEPYAGNWSTWVLRSAREMRLPSPPAATSLEATRELAQLKQAQFARTEAQIAAARFWDTGPATRRWTEIQLEMIKNHRPNPPRASRGLALVHIAMFDALIAAWHAKYAYRQPAPTSVDSTLVAALRPRQQAWIQLWSPRSALGPIHPIHLSTPSLPVPRRRC